MGFQQRGEHGRPTSGCAHREVLPTQGELPFNLSPLQCAPSKTCSVLIHDSQVLSEEPWHTFSWFLNVALLPQKFLLQRSPFLAKCAEQFVQACRQLHTQQAPGSKGKTTLQFGSGISFCHSFPIWSSLASVPVDLSTSLQAHIYFLPAACSAVSHSEDGIILSETVTLNYSGEACRCKTCCSLMQILGF